MTTIPNLDDFNPLSILFLKLSPHFIENSSYHTLMLYSSIKVSANSLTKLSLSSEAWEIKTSYFSSSDVSSGVLFPTSDIFDVLFLVELLIHLSHY